MTFHANNAEQRNQDALSFPPSNVPTILDDYAQQWSKSIRSATLVNRNFFFLFLVAGKKKEKGYIIFKNFGLTALAPMTATDKTVADRVNAPQT